MAWDNDGQKIFIRQSDYWALIEALRTLLQRYLSRHLCLDLESLPFLLEVDRCPTARILQSDIREPVFEQGYSQRGKFLSSDPQRSAKRLQKS